MELHFTFTYTTVQTHLFHPTCSLIIFAFSSQISLAVEWWVPATQVVSSRIRSNLTCEGDQTAGCSDDAHRECWLARHARKCC
eukprot:scaffold76559_cov15-Tisochrysis_lutea.AAC.1